MLKQFPLKKMKKTNLLLLALFSMAVSSQLIANPTFAEDAVKPSPTPLPSLTILNYKTYPLPGSLNREAVFNSNSPEIVTTEGILLSTFSPENKTNPDAHLNRPFQGKFDIFTHHIAIEREKGDLTTLYEGIILKNPTRKTIKLNILASATYNSQPDSPFIKLDDYADNQEANVFAGPGDRVDQDILRGKNYLEKREIIIKPNESFLLMNEPIPIADLTPPVNGRTSLFKLESDGPLYIADLALYEKKWLFGTKKPVLSDWLNILNKGNLSEKRDKVPSVLDQPRPKGQPFIYGRVSGVAVGNTWNATIINDSDKFIVPDKGQGISFALNTVYGNTLGTNQVQSANMEKRYPDTAYQTHANYAVTYQLEFPLYNSSTERKTVRLSFDTPLRIPENKPQTELSFNAAPPERIAFRGEFKLEYTDTNGTPVEKYTHVVQRFAEKGQPLLNLDIEPGATRKVKISYIYPADATPPHLLTISTD